MLEVVPQIHSHSSSGAHALAVALTSSLPLYSSAQLWRRSVLSSFMRCHAISIFLSGHHAHSWIIWAGRGRKVKEDGGGGGGRGGGSAILGFIRGHLIVDQGDCGQVSNERQLFGDGIN